jgi:hypothetical protein
VKPEHGHDVFGDGREKATRMQVSAAHGAGVQRNEEFGKGLNVISVPLPLLHQHLDPSLPWCSRVRRLCPCTG